MKNTQPYDDYLEFKLGFAEIISHLSKFDPCRWRINRTVLFLQPPKEKTGLRWEQKNNLYAQTKTTTTKSIKIIHRKNSLKINILNLKMQGNEINSIETKLHSQNINVVCLTE